MTETEQSIMEDLEMLGDGLNRLEYLLECGKAAPGIPESERTDSMLIRNCHTKTWMEYDWYDGLLNIRYDSLSLIIKGALSLICEIYENRTAEEVHSFSCSLTEFHLFSELLHTDQLHGIKSILKKLSEA